MVFLWHYFRDTCCSQMVSFSTYGYFHVVFLIFSFYFFICHIFAYSFKDYSCGSWSLLRNSGKSVFVDLLIAAFLSTFSSLYVLWERFLFFGCLVSPCWWCIWCLLLFALSGIFTLSSVKSCSSLRWLFFYYLFFSSCWYSILSSSFFGLSSIIFSLLFFVFPTTNFISLALIGGSNWIISSRLSDSIDFSFPEFISL